MKRCIVVLFFTSLTFVFIFSIIYAFCPRPELKTFTTYSSALFDSEGRLLRVTLAEDDRYRIHETLDQISSDFLAATILYEDQNFYNQPGVYFYALVRAFWTTYILNERRIGASTIAMQVARLRWNISSSTIKGKVEQIIRAIQLSRYYSKREILEAYVNLAPYGRNIEGIAAASLIYFNKKPQELSFPEIMTLAVIPQNPTKRNPTTSNGYKNLLTARKNLFARWIKTNPLDNSRKKYLEMPLNIRAPENLPFLSPHFTDFVVNRLSRWDNGRVDTSIDSILQNTLEGVVQNYVSSRSSAGISNAATLLVNHETMEIKAMVGSNDFFNINIQLFRNTFFNRS